MTNIYAHISDGDAPKSQHVTEVSFVDEKRQTRRHRRRRNRHYGNTIACNL